MIEIARTGVQFFLNGTTPASLAVERLRTFAPPEGEPGYYLAFSGGKDSCVLKAVADEAGVRYDAHYNVTGIDPPELVHFIRREYPDVTWERPEKSIFRAILENKLFPPTRMQRWCCELLKETGGAGRLVLDGVRAQESRFRKKRRMVERCMKGHDRRFVHPILDWSSADVWGFIGGRGLKYCELYDRGWKRIGCLLCPCAGRRNRMRDAKTYPRYAALFVKTFDKLIALRSRPPHKPLSWRTGAEMFHWWITEPAKRSAEPLPLFV